MVFPKTKSCFIYLIRPTILNTVIFSLLHCYQHSSYTLYVCILSQGLSVLRIACVCGVSLSLRGAESHMCGCVGVLKVTSDLFV